MEAVGQLTGGIAHDFNNILMVILGNLELLRMQLPDVDDATTELIDETLRATRHGQDLTGDLLAFSRRRQLNPQPVAINALVENIVRLLTRTLGASVTHHDRGEPRRRRGDGRSGRARSGRSSTSR